MFKQPSFKDKEKLYTEWSGVLSDEGLLNRTLDVRIMQMSSLQGKHSRQYGIATAKAWRPEAAWHPGVTVSQKGNLCMIQVLRIYCDKLEDRIGHNCRRY